MKVGYWGLFIAPLLLVYSLKTVASDSLVETLSAQQAVTVEMEHAGPDGSPMKSRGIFVSQNRGKLFNSKTLQALRDNSPSKPYPIFSLESELIDAEILKRQLEIRKISTEIFLIPDETYKKWIETGKATVDKMVPARFTFKDIPMTISREEIVLGAVVTTFRAALSLTWFSLGINPYAALSIAFAQTSMTALFNFGFKFTDAVFSSRIDGLNKKVSRTNETFRRLSFDYILNCIYRLASGPFGNVHGVATLTGQMEILTNLIFLNGSSSIFYFSRNRALNTPEKEFAQRWMGFNSFFFGSTLGLLDFVGRNGGVFFHIGPIPFTGTMAALMTGFLGGAYLIEKHTDKVVAFARKEESILKRVIDYFDGMKREGVCNALSEL